MWRNVFQRGGPSVPPLFAPPYRSRLPCWKHRAPLQRRVPCERVNQRKRVSEGPSCSSRRPRTVLVLVVFEVVEALPRSPSIWNTSILSIFSGLREVFSRVMSHNSPCRISSSLLRYPHVKKLPLVLDGVVDRLKSRKCIAASNISSMAGSLVHRLRRSRTLETANVGVEYRYTSWFTACRVGLGHVLLRVRVYASPPAGIEGLRAQRSLESNDDVARAWNRQEGCLLHKSFCKGYSLSISRSMCRQIHLYPCLRRKQNELWSSLYLATALRLHSVSSN